MSLPSFPEGDTSPGTDQPPSQDSPEGAPEALEATIVPVHVEPEARAGLLEGVPLAGSGGALTGVAVKVTRIQIKDTRPGLFESRKADVYPIFMVVTPGREPVLFQTLAVYNDVEPGSDLPISEVAPPTIARTLEGLPAFIDVHVLLQRSRERTRDVASAIEAARTSEEGKRVIAAITTAAAAANPAAAGITTLAAELLGLVCRALSQRRDRQLFYTVLSFDALPLGTKCPVEDDGAYVELEIRALPA